MTPEELVREAETARVAAEAMAFGARYLAEFAKWAAAGEDEEEEEMAFQRVREARKWWLRAAREAGVR